MNAAELGQRARARHWPTRCHDEAGVALILALAFLVAIGMTLMALVEMAGNDMLNSTNLKSQSALEYAADGVTDATVQWVRYGSVVLGEPCGEGSSFCWYLFDGTPSTTPGGSASTPAPCLPQGVPSMTVQNAGPSMIVYCVNDGMTSSFTTATRGVEFYACEAPGCTIEVNSNPYTCTQSGCTPGGTGSDDILQAHVQFQDYSTNGSISYGSAMTILSWIVETANS